MVRNEDLYHLFQRDALGKKVWDELCSLYYDIQSFDADNMYQTAFNEGRRSVILELMYRMQTTTITETDVEDESLL